MEIFVDKPARVSRSMDTLHTSCETASVLKCVVRLLTLKKYGALALSNTDKGVLVMRDSHKKQQKLYLTLVFH